MALRDLHLVLASPTLCAALFGELNCLSSFLMLQVGRPSSLREKKSSVENREEIHLCILKHGDNSRKESKRWSDLTWCKVRVASVDVFV